MPAFVEVTFDLGSDREAVEGHCAGGNGYVNHGFMFATSSGMPLDATNLAKKHFKPLLKGVEDLPTIRLYDLRHTAATLRLANGEHPKVVSEMLGHASTFTFPPSVVQYLIRAGEGRRMVPSNRWSRRIVASGYSPPAARSHCTAHSTGR